MKIKHFLSAIEHERVHQAIKSAEENSSGDIVVYISHRKVSDPLAAAHLEFRKLRLDKVKADNSLLIFLAPKTQKFAVVGGAALHGKVGQKWWDDFISLMTRHFKEGRFTEGIVECLALAGSALKTHFPAQGADRTGQKDIVEE
jgi:uncharacterized membrane protein